MFPNKTEKGCLVCKSALGDSPGPLCDGCLGVGQRRADRKKTQAKQPEPMEEENTGLSRLEEVLERDTQRIEQQARQRKGQRKVETETDSEEKSS